MGVPTLFKWLANKYPESIKDCVEDMGQFVDGEYIPPDLSKPNPNGIEFDNFYIDMNGIIHNCSHNEFLDKVPETDDDMFNNIFLYLDRLFELVRPRKLLYLAIDGVAPRAKMNQQRSRRFSAFQERQDRVDAEDELRAKLHASGLPVPPKKPRSWDSNQITPGTEFMMKVCDNMRYYIHERITTNPDWKDVTVILSDGTVPGEGEHKIMDFIRRQRAQPGYNPNTTHIIHGLDADLIMLGLATHEAHFYVLREEVVIASKQTVRCALCGSEGHLANQCQGKADVPRGRLDRDSKYMRQRLQILHLPILREYLKCEFEILSRHLPFEYDFENVVDDIVLLCFLVGNDFLPHLPCLRIREGALELLFALYKFLLPSMGGYFTSEGGEINLERLHAVFEKLAEKEGEILRIRRDVQLRQEQRRRARDLKNSFLNQKADPIQRAPENKEEIDLDAIDNDEDFDKETEVKDLAASINEELFGSKKEDEAVKSTIEEVDMSSMTEEEKTKMQMDYSLQLLKSFAEKNRKDDVEDTVKLGESGWQKRYYVEKFGKTHKLNSEFYEKIANSYVEGLRWIMLYYYKGCPSWDWYFPFHFAPCAFTLAQFRYEKTRFELSAPFRPLDQLMANQPPGCAYLLPKPCHELMESPNSPIFDFYPKRIEYDTNGLPFRWLWTALLPFIEKDRLITAMDSIMDQFTPEDHYRNRVGREVLCIRSTTPLGRRFEKGGNELMLLKDGKSYPIFGAIETSQDERSLYECVTSNPPEAFPRVLSTYCLMLHYIMPPLTKHSSHLVEGASPPYHVIDPSFLMKARPLDSQMDISSMGFIHNEEYSWGSNAPRPLRRDPRLQQKRDYSSNDYDSKRAYYERQSNQSYPSYPPRQPYPPRPAFPQQPYSSYPPRQPYASYPPQPYQSQPSYPPQPYSAYPPRSYPSYPPRPNGDISQNPLFNSRSQPQPPARDPKKPFTHLVDSFAEMKEDAVNLLAGALCGMTVDSILFPLDTIKTRFQARQGSVVISKYRQLFKGLGTYLVASVPASALYWTIYENVKENLKSSTNNPRLTPFCEMIAAAIGETVAGSIRNPFEVTKQYIQIRGYSNPFSAVLDISKERGIRALYSGYGPMLMRDIPFDMFEYCLYEAEKRWVKKHFNRELNCFHYMFLGMIAGASAAFVTCPLDVLKTRIMLSADLPKEQRFTVTETLRKLVREEGYRALFKGVTPRVMQISLGGALWFGAFEEYKRQLHKFL